MNDAPQPAAEPRPRVLCVDDDLATLEYLQEALEEEGIEVTTCPRGDEALTLVAKSPFDLILLDMVMPGVHGLEFMKRLNEMEKGITVVALSGMKDARLMKKARGLGIVSYLTKPINLRSLVAAIHGNIKIYARSSDVESPPTALGLTPQHGEEEGQGNPDIARILRGDLPSGDHLDYLGSLTLSREMLSVIRKARRVAGRFSCLLITGESGSGKTALVQHILEERKTPSEGMTALDCRKADRDLWDRALGGLESTQNRVLLLDHLEALRTDLQYELLDILDEMDRRDRSRPGGLCIAALASHTIHNCVEDGTLDESIYFGLTRMELALPPLNRRLADIPTLARQFLRELPAQTPVKDRDFALTTLSCFLHYPWPGNVRELRSVVESALWSSTDGHIEIEDLPTRLINHYNDHKGEIDKEVLGIIVV